MDSGRDWALSGAKATGETVLARVGSKGSGNLTLFSPQDESLYQAKEQSYGINVSIPIYGSGSAPPGFGLSASGLKLLAENESIKQQSSIVAGLGGYDVRVNGHTHLKGSAIASKATETWRNYFETQTLTHEDVQNRDVVSGKSWSVSVNISAGASGAGALAGSSVGFARMDTNNTSTQETGRASSSVGSLAGDVLGNAGGQYLQRSSGITALQGRACASRVWTPTRPSPAPRTAASSSTPRSAVRARP